MDGVAGVDGVEEMTAVAAVTAVTAVTAVKRRRSVAVGVSLVSTAALGLAGLATAPAVAASGCGAGHVCVYNASGSVHSYFSSDPDLANDLYADGSVVKNNVASVTNSSSGGYESHFYRNSNYNGFQFCVNPGSEVDNLPSGTGNRVGSLLLRTGTSVSCY